ncbi:MAG TPA: hypothetical protein VF628_02300 [Allosphingosinicella sp.]
MRGLLPLMLPAALAAVAAEQAAERDAAMRTEAEEAERTRRAQEAEAREAEQSKERAEAFAARAARQAERKASEDARADYDRAVAGEVAVHAELPEGEALHLRFADGNSFVPHLPPVSVSADELEARGGRALYPLPVEFASDAPPAIVNAAWLVAGDKAVRCEISGTLKTGGGASARIPSFHLIF